MTSRTDALYRIGDHVIVRRLEGADLQGKLLSLDTLGLTIGGATRTIDDKPAVAVTFTPWSNIVQMYAIVSVEDFKASK